MKKVFFIIPTLTGGGAERVFIHILRHIDHKKFEPILILFEKKGAFLSDLPSDISVKALKDKKSIYASRFFIFLMLANMLKNERPDAVVSCMWYTNLVTLLAKFLSRVKCGMVVSERSTLFLSYEGWFKEFLRRLTVRFFYPKAGSIVVNSKDIGIQLKKRFNISASKIAVIYNPIDIKIINEICEEEINQPWYKEDIPIIIAIGRLSSEKDFSCLIKAFHIVVTEGMPCRLVTLGKGIEEEKLKKLAMNLLVDDSVAFLGFQKNPYKYLARSTLFVLSSLYEGFPNALLEAMALGVPSIATRCPTGPEEIITDGVDGILVLPSDERTLALADAIKKVLQDSRLRKSLGEAAKKRVEDFRVEKIVKQYEDVIEGVCAESAAS